MDVTQKEEIETTAEDAAAVEAAFEAGFSGDVSAPPQEDKPAEQPEPAPAVQPEPAPEVAKPLSMDDVNAALNAQRMEHQKELRQLQDRLFGKTGELQQRIEKINTAKAAAGGISPKAKEKLTADFPELAALLFEDSPEPQPEPEPAPVYHAPQVDIDEVIQKRVAPLQLAVVHPDWKAVVASDDFSNWKMTLPPTDAAALDTSWDAEYLAGKITAFKTYQAAQQQKAAEEAQKAAEEAKKKERLEAAIVPRGVNRDSRPSLGDDDEEAAMAGSFKPWNKRH